MSFPSVAKLVDATSSRNGSFYVLFPDRFAGPYTETQAYNLCRAYGLVGPGGSVTGISSVIIEAELQAAEQELAAARQKINNSIPLTVQGASEDFIRSVRDVIVTNNNQAASQLSGIIATARDNTKQWVTTEANRVIAS